MPNAPGRRQPGAMAGHRRPRRSEGPPYVPCWRSCTTAARYGGRRNTLRRRAHRTSTRSAGGAASPWPSRPCGSNCCIRVKVCRIASHSRREPRTDQGPPKRPVSHGGGGGTRTSVDGTPFRTTKSREHIPRPPDRAPTRVRRCRRHPEVIRISTTPIAPRTTRAEPDRPAVVPHYASRTPASERTPMAQCLTAIVHPQHEHTKARSRARFCAASSKEAGEATRAIVTADVDEHRHDQIGATPPAPCWQPRGGRSSSATGLARHSQLTPAALPLPLEQPVCQAEAHRRPSNDIADPNSSRRNEPRSRQPMDLRRLRPAHRAEWDRLDGLAPPPAPPQRAEADELVSLYQRTATHLS